MGKTASENNSCWGETTYNLLQLIIKLSFIMEFFFVDDLMCF